MLQKKIIEIVLVLLFLLLASAVICLFDTDRLVISLVPRNLKIAAVLPASSWAWPGGNVFPWNILYKVAAVPAALIAFVALIIFLVSFWQQKYTPWRKYTIFTIFFIALGPGLLVNLFLKEEFGRARPREIIEFGGKQHFTEFWQPGTAGTNSSFPSGHAAIAFASIAPWFVLREKKRTVARIFLCTGLLFGVLVGIARILQGAHFVSDILWAGGLIYLVGSFLALLMNIEKGDEKTKSQQ